MRLREKKPRNSKIPECNNSLKMLPSLGLQAQGEERVFLESTDSDHVEERSLPCKLEL